MYSMPQDPAVILVIDEDPLMLTGVAATLDMSGYECHCARDAEAAHRAARSLNLDLIICEVDVDEGRGAELCQELRAEYGCEDVPVLFVSSGQAPEIIRRKHDVGATFYLRKPFDPDVLMELVGKALWMPHLVKARTERILHTGHHLPESSPPRPQGDTFRSDSSRSAKTSRHTS
jgi:two-component system chemotaxis response regulator CheY